MGGADSFMMSESLRLLGDDMAGDGRAGGEEGRWNRQQREGWTSADDRVEPPHHHNTATDEREASATAGNEQWAMKTTVAETETQAGGREWKDSNSEAT